MKKTINDIISLKGNKKIVMLSLYEYYFARIADMADIDIILVGDSMGNVLYGYDTTLPVSLDMVINHGAAVVRAVEKPFIVIDMPFLTYQVSIEKAIENAGLIMQKTGADAVKIETCNEHNLELIRRLVEIGIPVMGHLGLTPQSINMLGGYRKQGKKEKDAARIFNDALALQEAGCFSLVLENISYTLGKKITEKLEIPVIGIGAGPYTDGQVLVLHDILGIDLRFKPKFVKRYDNFEDKILNAIRAYKLDVENGVFPDKDNY